MTRALVTGATTPFGAELVNQLLASPTVSHVLAVGREPDAVSSSCRRPHFTYFATDLTRPRALHDLLYGPARDLGIDTIVHDAFHRDIHAVGRRAHALHVEATRQLIVDSERHPTIRRFVLRSVTDVYALRASEPNVIDENVALDFDAEMPARLRDRLEADLTVCSHLGRSPLSIAVLRCAEVLAPDVGSQLHDYLRSRVCFRPLGFDPMINVLSIEDCARAFVAACVRTATGVFNIAGADTMPLSELVRRAHRRGIPVPGPFLTPLYQLRARLLGLQFRYDANVRRFHFGGVVDGRRAADELGYVPRHSLWPHAFVGPTRMECPMQPTMS